jgi:retron-type reverse transcriptase
LLQRVEDCGRRERLVLWWLTYKLPVEREAVMVRYADDFVVLCRKGQGAEVYRRLKLWLERRKLKLNEEKTRVVNFEEDGLEFLGFQLSWRKGSSGRK